uniref:Uncharacterized protein n=1 Tax=Anthurium amnicola TaxID=1678845 RepID=A0A1D1XCV2_9ARAE
MSLHVKIRFMSVFPKKGAEKLLKSVRVRFEKLKKLEILNRMQGQNGVDLDTNRDTVSQTSRDTLMKNSNVGTADDGEDGSAAHEVEDDVVEDEEEEEELDEYESQPVVTSIVFTYKHIFLFVCYYISLYFFSINIDFFLLSFPPLGYC